MRCDTTYCATPRAALRLAVQVRLLREGGGELRWTPTEAPTFRRTASGGVAWRAAGVVPNSSRPPPGCRRLSLEVRGELDTTKRRPNARTRKKMAKRRQQVQRAQTR